MGSELCYTDAVIYPALLFLFAIDSIVTYIGIAHGTMAEYNPIVRHIIDGWGLGLSMAFLFLYKSGLLFMTAPWRHRTSIRTAWWGLFLFYSGALSYSWLVYLNHFAQ